MSPESLLEVRDLKISIRSDEGFAQVLDHVELTLRAGRILGVVGESGCGKSTLVKAILGILPRGSAVEQGSIRFEGEELLRLDEAELSPPEAPGAARGSARERHRARLVALLRRVQIPEPEAVLDRYPHQFSGGQRQRLLIAGALACAPRLVIADEPTTALDVTTQLQILRLLRELADEFGLSMLFVTHDFGVVAQLCDDLSVMYAGQTVEAGATADILREPRHPYTRALLDCHPDRAESLRGIPGSVPSALRPPPGCRFAPRCPEALPLCAARASRLVPESDGRGVNCRLAEPVTAT
jgi:oligopeptide/dipeptide ABC transporter ATP-binding protein